MRTSEEYMEQEGPFHAGKFLLHTIERDNLSPIPDPSAARRKEPKLTPDERFVFDEAVSSFRTKEMKRHGALEILMQDAFRRNDKRLFEIIAAASDFANEPYQTKHGKNVLAAMRCAAKIMIEEHRFPTKGEVKEMVVEMIGNDAFPIDKSDERGENGRTGSPARWTDVFRDARLRFLKRGDVKKSSNKHGEHSRSTREKIARRK